MYAPTLATNVRCSECVCISVCICVRVRHNALAQIINNDHIVAANALCVKRHSFIYYMHCCCCCCCFYYFLSCYYFYCSAVVVSVTAATQLLFHQFFQKQCVANCCVSAARFFFFFVDTVTYSSQLILFLSTALNYTHTHTQYTSTASHLFSQPVSHRVRQLLVCQCCGACKYATHKQAQHALVRVCRCVRSCVCLENYVKRKCIK